MARPELVHTFKNYLFYKCIEMQSFLRFRGKRVLNRLQWLNLIKLITVVTYRLMKEVCSEIPWPAKLHKTFL
jgi:hypothetical protein